MLVIPLFVGCVLGLTPAFPDGGGIPLPEKDQVAKWIRQLGSKRFQEREAAAHALDALGETSLDALQRALRDNDAEVRRRAGTLVQQIQQRAESARLLTPIRLQLDYDNVPVSEVIQDLIKKSGLRIRLASRRINGLEPATARISLRTGLVSFWEALDLVCEKAGLIERAALSGVEFNDMVRRGQIPMPALEAELTGSGGGTIYLEPGSRPRAPTSYAGAVRLRALPLAPDVRRQLTDQTGFLLEISPQPTLNWRALLGVRIDRALDQEGQILEPVFTPVSAVAGVQNGIPFDMESGRILNSSREFSVRLNVGDKPSRSLQEVRGAVLAQIQSPREPLVTVTNVMQSDKKTFHGRSGEVVSVLHCDMDKQSSLKIRVQLKENLPQAVAVAPNGRILRVNGGARRIFRGNANVIREQLIGAADWSLLDDEGAPVELTESTMAPAVNANGFIQDITLVYRMPAGSPKPAKLIYSGQRLVNIEVPFTLTRINLP